MPLPVRTWLAGSSRPKYKRVCGARERRAGPERPRVPARTPSATSRANIHVEHYVDTVKVRVEDEMSTGSGARH